MNCRSPSSSVKASKGEAHVERAGKRDRHGKQLFDSGTITRAEFGAVNVALLLVVRSENGERDERGARNPGKQWRSLSLFDHCGSWIRRWNSVLLQRGLAAG
jgi:hypothetical protein